MNIERGSYRRQPTAGTYQIGIVGGGWISTAYHLPILNDVDAATVSYVADIDPDQARKATRGYDARAIEIGDDPAQLPECDIVVLAIPVGVRRTYIKEFGERGTVIFSEKPFAVDSEMHQEFLTLAGDIGCNYMRTHYSATVQLRQVLNAGVLGTPERLTLVEEGKTGATGLGKDHFQTTSEKSGGGVLLERGCHSLSQIIDLFPDYDISVVSAKMERYDGLDAEVEAVFELSRGSSTVEVEYRISRLRPIGSSLHIECDNGTFVTDPFDPEEKLRIESGSGTSFTFEADDLSATTTHQAMYLRWQEFLSRLSAGELDAERETMPRVTQVITNIYEEAT
jgi:predicted dehydrogenase